MTSMHGFTSATVSIRKEEDTNKEFAMVFVDDHGYHRLLKCNASVFKYNPFQQTLTIPKLVGDLRGRIEVGDIGAGTPPNHDYPLTMSYSASLTEPLLNDTALKFNPSTETLTCSNITASTAFNGNLNGKITVLDGSLLTGNQPLLFTANSPGAQEHVIYDSGLYFNPSTDTLTMQNTVANVDILAKGDLGTLNNLDVGGNAEVSGSLEVAGAVTMTSTNAVQIPSGTTAQRPTGVNGMMRYNSTTAEYEVYKGSGWENINKAPSFEYIKTETATSYSLATNTDTSISALSVTITPTSTSAKVHINVSVFGEFSAEGLLFNHMLFLKRTIDSTTTELRNSTANVNARGISCLTRTYAGVDNYSTPESGSFTYVDEPNTTSDVTYTVWMWNSGGGAFVLNRVYVGGTTNAYEYGMSTISTTCYN